MSKKKDSEKKKESKVEESKVKSESQQAYEDWFFVKTGIDYDNIMGIKFH